MPHKSGRKGYRSSKGHRKKGRKKQMGLIEDLRAFESTWEHKRVLRTVQLPGMAAAAVRESERALAAIGMVEPGWEDIDPATDPFDPSEGPAGSLEVVTLLVVAKRIKRRK